MKNIVRLFIVATVLALSPFAQGLFEEATSGDENASLKYELNGYARGVMYGGKVPDKRESDVKSVYGEAALKVKFKKANFGDAVAEIRFRDGNEFGQGFSEVNLREAYVNAYLGPLDIRLGKQIVVWGRADGINPTNNITPQNMIARSPDEDDRREGNTLLRTWLNFRPLRLEGVFVPVYRASVLPLHLVKLEDGIVIGDAVYPKSQIKKSAYALKLNLEMASFDGSISWFTGYNPLPGFNALISMIPSFNVALVPIAYRQQVYGADFSTTIASLFGLRGEFAFRLPEDNEYKMFVPNSDMQYVLGLDKDMGNLSILGQYVGRYVFDYELPQVSLNPMVEIENELIQRNQLFSGQQDEISHSAFCRIAYKMLHETFVAELPGMYNFTTQESMVRPNVYYDITDALRVRAGAELYFGPKESLYGMIDENLGAGFLELKASF
ncbi:MAG: hypothetical protein HQK83_00405 [Fibrobacteria bacterium]|nr:hypothetical protein [Fibrobacteria bacterium]